MRYSVPLHAADLDAFQLTMIFQATPLFIAVKIEDIMTDVHPIIMRIIALSMPKLFSSVKHLPSPFILFQ